MSEADQKSAAESSKNAQKEREITFSVLSLTENTLKLSLPFGQVKLSLIVKFTL